MGKYSIQKRQMKTLGSIAKYILSLGSACDFKRTDLVPDKNRSTIWRYNKSVDDLVKDGYLIISGEKISITKRGLRLLEGNKVFDLEIKKYKWDGVWHVITYDIPEKLRCDRNFLRNKLKHIGFRQIQQSLWVYPYRCEEEVGLLINELKLSNYVAFLTTRNIPYNEKYLRKFRLKN